MIIDFNKDPFTQDELEDIKKESKRIEHIKFGVQVIAFIFMVIFGVQHAVNSETEQGITQALAIILVSFFGIWLLGDLFALSNTKLRSRHQLEDTNCSPKDVWQYVRHRPDLLLYVDKVIAMKRSLIVLEVNEIKEAFEQTKKKDALNNWISDYSALKDNK
ncbi:hypothetical protein J4N45_10225 [Vibrio sp. SCSIO 43140]|uniref:hypothetical protein n=1 Tax=Vibrio sp. SCSIO 43140 TaxID=2819100 RepID=UPI0020761728|nr:hypothetical protein [Vibrio sp. SCSIO 43140]USD58905.1 hypothetical protein J4N45_10225 [Vibrio sp. SCSIO 43140]